MSEDIRHKFHQLPKADVHNHLHLGGTAKRLREKYRDARITFPETYDGLDGMIDFIYGTLNKIMLTKDDVKFFMEMAIESSIDDNITHLEASVDIGLARFFDDSIEQVIEVVMELKERYESQIDFRPDIGVNKDLALDKVYSDGVKCIKSNVFSGIDIYGKEVGRQMEPFLDLFDQARNHDLKTKVHIGEFSSHETIESAINILHPDELQHGIRAVDSEQTMNLILENNIRLNVCPQSNFALGSSASIAEHPMRKLFDRGINLTINTDDLLLFDASVTDQFLDLHKHEVFSFEELDEIRKNAFL
ncbi:MAG: hypothetical protein KJP09_04285 [Bacteroidia bacterium]|nr:hypothetical protein [Bacteroidia bacterium]